MFYIIIWIVLCVLVGAFANSRGRSFIGYALLAVVISPLISFIIVAVLGRPDNVKVSDPSNKKDSGLDL